MKKLIKKTFNGTINYYKDDRCLDFEKKFKHLQVKVYWVEDKKKSNGWIVVTDKKILNAPQSDPCYIYDILKMEELHREKQ